MTPQFYNYLAPLKLYSESLITFTEFSKIWNKEITANERSYDFLSEYEKDVVEELMEKIDYVSNMKSVNNEDRRYGWITSEEFKKWITIFVLEKKIIIEKSIVDMYYLKYK